MGDITEQTPHYAYEFSSVWEWQTSPHVTRDIYTCHHGPIDDYVVGQRRHVGNDGAFCCPLDIASQLLGVTYG